MFNKKYLMSLDETLILKGISILVIILHNFIHRFPDAVMENQHVFLMERNCELVERFLHISPGILLDLISHYGHYGVPVFVFLSGYGLVVKYENRSAPMGFQKYIRRHIGKLWLLLLPLLVPHLSEVQDDIIARVPYPTNESTLNGANWQEAVSNLTDGTNNYYSKMYWDVRTSTYNHPANR